MKAESRRHAPLAFEDETFRALGHRLVDQIADGLARIPSGPVTRCESASAVRAALDLEGGLPEHGTPPGPLLEETAARLFEHSLFNAHPRFFGYITAPAAPIGILGDLLAAAVNPNVGAWALSPAATEIEAQTVRWIAEFIGYPVDCGGLLVSGGNMANFVGFLAGRAAKAPWDVARSGVTGRVARAARIRLWRAHTWIQKAADIAGLGTNAIRWIPTDDRQRMDVPALYRQLAADTAAGDVPCIVIGNAGSVSTGAVDPLRLFVRCVREYRSGFMSMARMVVLRPECRIVRRFVRGQRGRFRGRRSTQMAVCAARGRMRAGARSGRAARRVCVSPAVLPLRGAGDNYVDLARRTRAAFGRSRSGWRCGR